jgi:hypothetical protein
MSTDNSFLRFTKNNFALAKNGDNPPIATLKYDGFLQMLPTETWFQISNSATSISFVAGVTVELIDKCENVVQNITSKFFYEIFTDSNGIEQIAFEFGNIVSDYSTKPLYLRITDNTNLNKWYSNSFLLTSYRSELTARFDYWSDSTLNGIDYDVAPYKQSIRFSDFYYNDNVDEENSKQYTKYDGNLIAYRSVITDLDQYNISAMDSFSFRRFQRLCQSPFVYLNYTRVIKSEVSKEARLGDTNWFNASFTCNPQNETLTYIYQFYEPFNAVSRFVANNSIYTLTNFNTAISGGIYINFNKAPSVLPTFEYKLYKNNVLVLTASANTIATNKLTLDDLSSYTFANGDFALVVNSNTVYNSIEFWDGYAINQWNWTIINGEYDNNDYNNDFLIN